MIHVVTIIELSNLIPECKQLDGIDFKDLKHLITEIIQTVELSGKWEYVQYIQSKPSLFIVREKEIMIKVKEKVQIKTPLEEIKTVENSKDELINNDSLFPKINLSWNLK